jgi:hypothetical protein
MPGMPGREPPAGPRARVRKFLAPHGEDVKRAAGPRRPWESADEVSTDHVESRPFVS